MPHPPAVCEKAQRLERLLQRVERGESLEQVCAELGVRVAAEELPKLQARYEAGGRSWEALIDGRYGHPQKAHSALREWLYQRKREDESLTAGELAREVAEQFQVELSVGHLNYLLRKVGLTGPRGHPRGRKGKEEASSASSAESLAHAGLFFPRRGKDPDGGGGACGGVSENARRIPNGFPVATTIKPSWVDR